ncbi:MAG: branched-chain amino acid ABC transporter permease [Gammaproteobacteria bacterium]|nr:branched-chain amino acid ABC transporter permease [Gammaproteobacteria bacterium]
MNTLLRSLVGGIGLALIPVLIGVFVMLIGETAQVRTVNFFLINLIIVLGLQVSMGNSNIANLGHVTFMGIAAYGAAVLSIPITIKATILPDAPFGVSEVQLGVVQAALIGIAVSTCFAFLTGLVLSRQSGIAATIITLALIVVVHTVFINWNELTRGARALYGIPIKTNIVWLMAVAAIAVVIARLFRDSTLGVQLRASGEDFLAAAAMGVNVTRLRLVAWVLSGAIISVAGVMYTFLIGSISPKSFYFETVFLTLAMLILGGMRSVSGAVIGAVVVTIGFEFMRYLESAPEIVGFQLPQIFGLTGFFLGTIIVLSMALRPDGIVGNDELDEMLQNRVRDRQG